MPELYGKIRSALASIQRHNEALGPLTRQWQALCERGLGRLLSQWRSGGGTPLTAEISRSIRDDLTSANTTLEQIVLGLSDQFEPLVDQMQSVVDASQKLAQLAAGAETSRTALTLGVSLLRGPLDFIDDCNTREKRLLDLLDRCEQQMSSLRSYQAQVSELLAPMAFVEVLFKVESAGLDFEQHDTFVAVSADISRLRKLVADSFQKNADLLATTEATLAEVRRRLDANFQKRAVATSEKRQRVGTALERLDTQLAHNSAHDNHALSLNRNLAEAVSGVVAALQFQDIIKQKCDHVIEALESAEREGHVDPVVLQLQAAQLERVDHDIRDAVSEVEKGMARILEQAAIVDRRCMSTDEVEGLIAAADGMVEILLDAIEEVQEILGQTTLHLAAAHAEVDPARTVADKLRSTMGELAVHMRLVALNAQVRSVQLSPGTGLEVLAVRTAEISARVNSINNTVASRLATLRDETGEMFALFDEFCRRGDEQKNHLHLGSPAVETELHQLRNDTLMIFQSMSDSVVSIHTAAENAQAKLSAIESVKSLIGQSCDRLSRVHQEIDRNPPAAATPSAKGALHSIARNYTMAGERHVHAAIIGAAATLIPAAPSSTSATVAPEPATPPADNLFDAPPALARAGERFTEPALAIAGVDTLGSNVELF